MEKEHEWHNIADVNVQRVCDNSIVALTLYVKIINGERLQKTVDIHPPKTGISVHFSDSFILMALQI
jgi:hypothetical protein